MKYYGLMRTKNGKGVTIPSQIRYVFYFEKTLRASIDWNTINLKKIKLIKIRVLPVPSWWGEGFY